MEITINNIKKELYKTKVNAIFSHYCAGNLYYNISIFGEMYQFPISTIERESDSNEIILSPDLGTTTFSSEIKGSELNRWIDRSVNSGSFISLGSVVF